MKDPELADELKALIIQTLNLEVSATQIDPNAPLFGEEGLGLDSLDALDLVVEIEYRYGLSVKLDKAAAQKVFYSLGSLADFVAEHRKE